MKAMDAAERERLTLDAIDTLQLIDEGKINVTEALELAGEDALAGMVLLANLLETMLYLTRGQDIPVVRDSCRVTAKAWRTAKAEAVSS